MIVSVAAWLLWAVAASAAAAGEPILNATLSGYLTIDHDAKSKMFYAYFEEQERSDDFAPIIVWLQGGPGCSSLFGMLYELGPNLVDDQLRLRPNPGSWNRHAALLFIDQPVGTGFSIAGKHGIPTDEMHMAADLYIALQAFFLEHEELRSRPLIIAGESYAGKYVPSIGHFILQQSLTNDSVGATTTASADAAATGSGDTSGSGAQRRSNLRGAVPSRRRFLPPRLLAQRSGSQHALLEAPPLFDLRGLVIGNGLTHPARQVMTHADTAASLGLIDLTQRVRAMTMQLKVVQLIDAGLWPLAHKLRSDLLAFLAQAGGLATALDVRRYEDYDAGKTVDGFLNLPDVKVQAELGVPGDFTYESCSEAVGAALGPDVMKSVADLFPDLLSAYDLLLYQGQYDIQDGPASTEAWVSELDWSGRASFNAARRRVVRAWKVDDGAAGTGMGQGAGAGAGAGGGEQKAKEWCCEVDTDEGTGSGDIGQLGGVVGGVRQTDAAAAVQRRALLAAAGAASAGGTVGWAGGEGSGMGGGAFSGGVGREGDARAERVAAYWKHSETLTHVVVRDAGHMAPRDQGRVTQWMLERWLDKVLSATT